jgi:uncharacterized protein (TIGR04551 family)
VTPAPPDLLDRIASAFVLHGHFRVRPELMHNFALGWDRPSLLIGQPGAYRNANWPWARNPDNGLLNLCSISPLPNTTARIPQDCANNTQTMANMRLRLQPEIHVTDGIAVHAQIDVFDNLIMGSTPAGYASSRITGSSPWAPYGAASQTQVTPTDTNSLSPAITVSRAWAEVTNTTLGQLRFGRMPWHWGLGILSNAGNGIDSDFQTHVDRIMYQFRVRPISLFAALMYDFASTGLTSQSYRYEPGQGQPIDLSTLDDVNQYGLAVGRRVEAAEARQTLSRGGLVWNAGFYGLYRRQVVEYTPFNPMAMGMPTPRTDGALDIDTLRMGARRVDATVFTGDLWFQLLHRNFRLEVESVLTAGSVNINPAAGNGDPASTSLLQFGAALEFEYRLLNNRLQIEFRTGYASGDSDLEGLGYHAGDVVPRRTTPSSNTQFSFHPDYRVDLILWRQVLRQMSGAYYFRPGVMYAFVDSPRGDRLYGRASAIWSRASQFVQTRGNDPDLGIELDAEVTYLSNWRDTSLGSSMAPGFFASAQFGLLIPMAGLGPRADERAASGPLQGFEFSNPYTLRGVVGVIY